MPRRCQSLPMKYVAALDVQAPVLLYTSITWKRRPRGPAERDDPYVIVYDVYRYSCLLYMYIYIAISVLDTNTWFGWSYIMKRRLLQAFGWSFHCTFCINPQSRGWWYGGTVLDWCAGGWEWPCAFYLRLQASHALRLSGRWSCHAGLWDAPCWMGWNLNDMTFVRFQWDLADLSMLWFRNPKSYIMWFAWWIPGYQWSDRSFKPWGLADSGKPTCDQQSRRKVSATNITSESTYQTQEFKLAFKLVVNAAAKFYQKLNSWIS